MAANPPTQGQPLLEVEGMSKRFGDSVALANVSFSIHEKEIVGVIGPNGVVKNAP
jgi:branched-chain amino acid transport system ATP-binding protein